MLFRALNLATSAAIVTVAVFGSAIRGAQDIGRTPIQPAAEPTDEDLQRITVRDLLVRIAAAPKDDASTAAMPSRLQLELRARAESCSMSDDEWRAALLATDVIHTRPKWPASEPLMIWIHQRSWLRLTRITVQAIEPAMGTVGADNSHPSHCGNCGLGQLDRQRRLSFQEPLPKNLSRVSLDVSIEQLESPDASRFKKRGLRPLWHGQLDLPVQSADGLESCLPKTSEPAQLSAIRESLHAFWTSPKDGSTPELYVIAGGTFERYPALRGVGVSLALEMWNAGSRVDLAQCVVDSAANWKRSEGLRGSCRFTALPAELALPGADVSAFEIRVVGTRTDLLEAWDIDRWWNGSFSMPLAQALAQR